MSAITTGPHQTAAAGRSRPGRLPRLLRGPAADPRWARPALLALLALTALLYAAGLSRNGWANDFYSAAVQAGTRSWKAFFFGSFDASSFISVDKTPASLWVMELSARVFGLNYWSVLLPQAAEGAASVAVLCAAVRRWSGPVAGLIAAGALAVTPVATLMFRFNNPDALLALLMTVAAGPGRGAAVGWLADRHRAGVQLHERHHPSVLHGRAGPRDRRAGRHRRGHHLAGPAEHGHRAGARRPRCPGCSPRRDRMVGLRPARPLGRVDAVAAAPDPGLRAGRGRRGDRRALGPGPGTSGLRSGSTAGRGPGGQGGGFGGLGGSTRVSSAITKLLASGASGYRWAAATVGAESAAPFQLASGEPVMAIGGFNGTDQTPSLAQFTKMVAAHEVHYFIGANGHTFGGGSGDAAQITSWVESHFTGQTVGGVTLYDLARPASS